MMASLEMVDAVCLLNVETPAEIIELLKPNVLVKGGDYTEDQIIGNELVENVVIIPLVSGFSTTSLMG